MGFHFFQSQETGQGLIQFSKYKYVVLWLEVSVTEAVKLPKSHNYVNYAELNLMKQQKGKQFFNFFCCYSIEMCIFPMLVPSSYVLSFQDTDLHSSSSSTALGHKELERTVDFQGRSSNSSSYKASCTPTTTSCRAECHCTENQEFQWYCPWGDTSPYQT